MILSDRQEGNICIIDIIGEITGTTARNKHFNSYIEKRLEKKKPIAIALNMEKVEAVDSFGLGVIAQLYQLAEEKKIGFALFQVNKDVFSSFNLTGINELASIFDTEEETLTSFAKKSKD
ncbi:MAG: anti-sigma factor antagonist [SAR324 cluster bacterium]|nr:anti-sigma factor antagonist [SAR324 cluster bacterium]